MVQAATISSVGSRPSSWVRWANHFPAIEGELRVGEEVADVRVVRVAGEVLKHLAVVGRHQRFGAGDLSLDWNAPVASLARFHEASTRAATSFVIVVGVLRPDRAVVYRPETDERFPGLSPLDDMLTISV